MQTVYLLKDCYKSYIALKNLYNCPDLSTNIIIVDNNQARILHLDKRVKKFPFIINTPPTSIGLIPKISSVLPLEMFMMLKKFDKKPNNRTISIPTKSIHVEQSYYRPKKQIYRPKQQIYRPKQQIYRPKSKPLIRTIKENDGSVNIVLNNNK